MAILIKGEDIMRRYRMAEDYTEHGDPVHERAAALLQENGDVLRMRALQQGPSRVEPLGAPTLSELYYRRPDGEELLIFVYVERVLSATGELGEYYIPCDDLKKLQKYLAERGRKLIPVQSAA